MNVPVAVMARERGGERKQPQQQKQHASFSYGFTFASRVLEDTSSVRVGERRTNDGVKTKCDGKNRKIEEGASVAAFVRNAIVSYTNDGFYNRKW